MSTDERSHLTGAERIAEERHRQIALGYGRAYDADEHDDGALARAAWCYLEAVVYENSPLVDLNWPFDGHAKVVTPIRNLEKAGALIAAEIDRLQRPFSSSVQQEESK